MLLHTPALRLCIILCLANQAYAQVAPRQQLGNNAAAMQALHNLPPAFESNLGQAPGDIQFLCRTPRSTVFLKSDKLLLAFNQSPASAASPENHSSRSPSTRMLTMSLAGASANAPSSGEEEIAGQSNYFIGADPAKWQRNVPRYARVRYQGIYPGIDAVYYGTDKDLEYDFVVAQGANPDALRLRFSGQDSLKIDRDGNLLLKASGRQVITKKPVAYQLHDGTRHPVSARFVQAGGEIRIRVGAYNHTESLIIDPKLVYSTYLGGTDDEGIFGIGFDLEGNIYLAGETSSRINRSPRPASPIRLLLALACLIASSRSMISMATRCRAAGK